MYKLLVLLSFMFVGVNSYTQTTQLLLPGQYHDDEIADDVTFKQWLGLFEENGVYFIRKTNLRITKVHDPIFDDDTLITSGDRVDVEDKGNCIMLISGVDEIKTGKVKSVIPVTQSFYKPGESSSFDFGMFRYVFSATGDGPDPETDSYHGIYNLFLDETAVCKKQQLIASDTLSSETPFTILWMGDLNGDHHLDLLIDLSYHYNVSITTLFLSPGNGDHLLKQVAQHTATGC